MQISSFRFLSSRVFRLGPAVTGLILGIGLSTLATSAAAESIYAFVKGAKQGVLRGEVTYKGHEGSTKVTKLTHTIDVPMDPVSGLPTGRRIHRPFTLTHSLGAMAVQLLAAESMNENLPEVIVQIWDTDPSGREVLATNIKLTNAIIASISTKAAPQGNALEVVQEVSFTYQKIEVTDVRSNITMGDDFNQRM